MGKEFWLSEQAAGYPDDFGDTDGSVHILKGSTKQREMIGRYLIHADLVPHGQILDIGAASCSGMIFGDRVARTRVTAVDISPVLLARNPVPRNRKLVMDVGREDFPYTWEGSFSLATSILLHRYLTDEESFHLAQQVQHMLEEDGVFVILEQPAIPQAQLGAKLGEVRVFDAAHEADILLRAGFSDVEVQQVPFWETASELVPPVILGQVVARL